MLAESHKISFEQARRAFLDFVSIEKGASSHTVSSYGHDLDRYGAWLEEQNISDLSEIDTQLVEAYMAHLADCGLARSSIMRAASSLKGFHKFLVRESFSKQHPAAELPVVRRGMTLPKALSINEVNALLDQPFESTPAGFRDRVMLELLYGCGLRASELVQLNLGDIDYEDFSLRIIGKGDKERLVPTVGSAQGALKAWLEEASGRASFMKAQKPSSAVFLNSRGGRLSRQSLHKIVERRGALVGIKQLHPHILRHTFASHLLQGGADLRSVQELLGHASVTTTQIYTHLQRQHLFEIYQAAHPRVRQQTGRKCRHDIDD